jgi:hypothetical protein
MELYIEILKVIFFTLTVLAMGLVVAGLMIMLIKEYKNK